MPQRGLPARLRQLLFVKSGGRCTFPGCGELQWDSGGAPLVELVHITRVREGGADGLDNLTVLCPAHHCEVDRNPDKYPASWLIATRDQHFASVADATTNPRKSSLRKSPLAEALDAWAANTDNYSEEFWQKLFEETPACLVAVLGGRAYTLRSQCYVGGKSFNNKGGKVLDFLALYASNVACVEIKTPATRLLGRRYRDNVYSPSPELAGACVQVLESRRSLMRNVATLTKTASPSSRRIRTAT